MLELPWEKNKICCVLLMRLNQRWMFRLAHTWKSSQSREIFLCQEVLENGIKSVNNDVWRGLTGTFLLTQLIIILREGLVIKAVKFASPTKINLTSSSYGAYPVKQMHRCLQPAKKLDTVPPKFRALIPFLRKSVSQRFQVESPIAALPQVSSTSTKWTLWREI